MKYVVLALEKQKIFNPHFLSLWYLYPQPEAYCHVAPSLIATVFSFSISCFSSLFFHCVNVLHLYAEKKHVMTSPTFFFTSFVRYMKDYLCQFIVEGFQEISLNPILKRRLSESLIDYQTEGINWLCSRFFRFYFCVQINFIIFLITVSTFLVRNTGCFYFITYTVFILLPTYTINQNIKITSFLDFEFQNVKFHKFQLKM